MAKISFEKFIEQSKYYSSMKKFVDAEQNLCPKRENVFRFLKCDLEKTKCIILGMDPYSTTYINGDKLEPVATGRAFEVANIEKWTDGTKNVSLTNIFKALINLKYNKIYTINEIRDLVERDGFRYIKIRDWFDAMEKEGVIFLNATLTTIYNKTGVHESVWTNFMNELLLYIVNVKKDIKWLIFGESAKKRVKDIVPIENIIYTCHPAARMNNTFVKDCLFKKVKDIEWI